MVTGAVNTIVGNLMPMAIAGFKAGLTVWIAYVCYRVILGRSSEPLWSVILKLVAAAAIGSAMSLSMYNQGVTNIFLNDLPNHITSAIAGGNNPTANSFDTLFDQAFTSGLKIWKGLSAWSIVDYGTMGLVVVFWVLAAISEGIAYVIWLMSKELLALLIAIGPIPLACFLFPPVRSLFERWVGAVLSCILLQAMLAAFLGILVRVEMSMLANMTTSTAASGVGQIPLLLGVCLVFVVAALLVHQLPGAATGLSGGLSFHAAAVSRAAYTPAMRAAQQAHAAIPGPAQAIGGGIGALRRRSAGASLSRSGSTPP
jgi:type IV secretion system protein VirB6